MGTRRLLSDLSGFRSHGAPRRQAADASHSTPDAYFDRNAKFWDELYTATSVYSEIHRLRQAVALRWVDELALPPRSAVLELGCGAGRTAIALAERGLRVTATDSVPAMLDRARENAEAAGVANALTFAVVDAQAVPLADESVELVLALGLLPWVPDPGRALAEMSRLVKPGGAVIVNVDNAARLHYALDPRFNRHLAPARGVVSGVWHKKQVRYGARAQLHSIREFDALLRAAGLEKVRGQTLGFGPFSLLGRRLLPERMGLRLQHVLQERADKGTRGLADRGAQYLVLARRPK